MTDSSSHRWIPWTFVGGLAVVIAVNGLLAYFAATSATGLVTEHPFESGNSYNRVLAAGAAQDALGWHGTAQFLARGYGRGEIAVEFSDAAGRPIRGLAVTARFERPVDPLPDRTVSLAETAAGHYVAAVALDRPGQWELRIGAARGHDRFAFAQRIIAE